MKLIVASAMLMLANADAAAAAAASVDYRIWNYEQNSTNTTLGVNDWDQASNKDHFYDWSRLVAKVDQDDFKCIPSVNPKNDQATQSPIDIDDWDDCDGDKDDKHRWWMDHGTCQWNQMDFRIESWGLMAEFPIPAQGSKLNPERYPCLKPHFDSSGGFGDRFYTSHVSVKVPSEHTLQGKQYPAEINIANFRWKSARAPFFIQSILVDASDSYPDNPILHPYLVEWYQRHYQAQRQCGYDVERSAATDNEDNTGAPTAPPTPEPFCFDDLHLQTTWTDTGGEQTDEEGIMFDITSINNETEVVITEIDINIEIPNFTNKQKARSSFTGEVTIEIYSKHGTHRGHETRPGTWTLNGVYKVYPRGKGEPTLIILDTPLVIRPEDTRALYVVEREFGDLQLTKHNKRHVGRVQASDSNLQIHVGTAKEGRAFAQDDDQIRGRGFSGRLHYSLCRNVANMVDPNIYFNPTVKETREEEHSMEARCVAGNHLATTAYVPIDNDTEHLTKNETGIYFTLASNAVEREIYIEAFDLRLARDFMDNQGPQVIQVKLQQGFLNATSTTTWNDHGTYSVIGSGPDAPTLLDLYEPIVLMPGEILSVHIREIGDSTDMVNIVVDKNTTKFGDIHTSDGNLEVLAGVSGNDQTSIRAFSGVVHYQFCNPEEAVVDNHNNNNKIQEEEEEANRSDVISDTVESTSCRTFTHGMTLARGNASTLVLEVAAIAMNETVTIHGFDLDLSSASSTNTTISVYSRANSLHGTPYSNNTAAWVSHGEYSQSSYLRLKEPALVFPHEAKVFLITELTGLELLELLNQSELSVIVNGVENNNTNDEDDHSSRYLQLELGMLNETTSVAVQARGLNGGSILYSICQTTTNGQRQRRLDHGPRNKRVGPFDFALYPQNDVFRLLPSPFFYKYVGSFTMPSCYDKVQWRINQDIMRISTRQLELIEVMIAQATDVTTCERITRGRKRSNSDDLVDVNRPTIFNRIKGHTLKLCDSGDWSANGFYETPRANSRWDLLESQVYGKTEKNG